MNFWEAVDLVEPIGLPALDQIQKVQTAAICSFISSAIQDPDSFSAFPQLQGITQSPHATRQAEIDQFES